MYLLDRLMIETQSPESDPSAIIIHMTFTRPVVGPKVYLSRGTSGHAETFQRSSSDRELEMYLGKIKIALAVDGFIRKMLLDRRAEKWSDVLDYLAGLTKLDVDIIPINVAVSFWAHVDQARDAAKKAKAEAEAHAKGN